MGQQLHGPAKGALDEYQSCEQEPGRKLEVPVAPQEVFGKLMWKPERVQELLQEQHIPPLAGRTGHALLAMASIAVSIAGCAPDYVYIQNSRSEGEVRQDYTVCAEQQFKVSNNTTECMERKGYRTVKIDATSPATDHDHSSPTPHALP
jgi:hypothetical protein